MDIIKTTGISFGGVNVCVRSGIEDKDRLDFVDFQSQRTKLQS